MFCYFVTFSHTYKMIPLFSMDIHSTCVLGWVSGDLVLTSADLLTSHDLDLPIWLGLTAWIVVEIHFYFHIHAIFSRIFIVTGSKKPFFLNSNGKKLCDSARLLLFLAYILAMSIHKDSIRTGIFF